MTNLTDLLPAGAGGKQVSFTASGAISSGQTVGLKSDGTVGAITGKTGSSFVFESAGTNYPAAVFDSNSNKVVIAYQDEGNSNYGTAVVATVSGSTISYGTPVVFESASISSTSIAFDSSNNKVVITYQDAGNNFYGTSAVGTVSGTSISFGTPVVFASVFISTPASTFDSNANKVVITYGDQLGSYSACVVGTVSGTSISFGTKVNLANYGLFQNIVFDSTNNKVIVLQRKQSGFLGEAYVGTVSGTSISYGTPSVYGTTTVVYVAAAFDSNSGKVVIAYDQGNTGTAIVGTVSGTSISFGSERVFTNVSVTINRNNGTFDSTNNVCLVIYKNDSTGYQEVVELSVSGTTTTQSGPFVVLTDTVRDQGKALAYDSNANKTVIAYDDGSNSNYGTAVVYDTDGVSNADFIGIADAAISDTASGNITIKGGIAGTVAYDSGIGAETSFDNTAISSAITYDANAQKVVVFYDSSDNSSYGYGVVGTISGTSSSWGSSGSANTSGFVQWVDIVYDSNAQKVVAVYNNGTLSDHGYAVVGTVSGTSISWGTPVKYESAGVYYNAIVYDSNSQKVVISYYDAGNSNYGTSIVGTVSGTSISFGTAVVFNSASTFGISSAFDSVNNKVVNAYRDVGSSNEGRAVVGTVSGTSISFGSDVAFNTTSNTPITATTFDANAGKIVIAYRSDPSNEGKAIVGTVSGTSISFGTEATFSTSTMGSGERYIAAEYDPSTQTVLIGFRDEGDSNYGKTIVGTVSGTSISFASEETFSSAATLAIDFAYDSNAQKMIVIYRNASGVGQSRVYTPDTTLTPNTTYYVQDDGTLSTTSSSVTAGKALSATSINLDYSS